MSLHRFKKGQKVRFQFSDESRGIGTVRSCYRVEEGTGKRFSMYKIKVQYWYHVDGFALKDQKVVYAFDNELSLSPLNRIK